jgi:hypothetical protein
MLVVTGQFVLGNLIYEYGTSFGNTRINGRLCAAASPTLVFDPYRAEKLILCQMRHNIKLCTLQFALLTVQHTDTDVRFGMDHGQAHVTFISSRFLYACSLYHKAAQETVVISCCFFSFTLNWKQSTEMAHLLWI